MSATQERLARRLPRYNPSRIIAATEPRTLPRYNPPRVAGSEEDLENHPMRLPVYRPHAFDDHLSAGVAERENQVPIRALPVYNPLLARDERAVRPRLVTGAPGVANERSAMDRLRDLYATQVEDQNGRLRSGGNMALQAAGRAAASGDLGYTAGAAIGAMLGGILAPRGDEKFARVADIEKQQRIVGIEAAQEKQRREQESANVDLDYKRAQTEKARRLPVYKPTYKKQGGITYKLDEDGTATPIVGANGEALMPDTQRPVFVDTLGEDGVTMTRNQYDPRTGKYEPLTIGGGAAVVKRVQRINTDTGMTENQEVTDEDRDAIRDLGGQRLAETKRRNVVTEGQAAQRIASSGTRGGGGNADRNKAMTEIGKLNSMIAKWRGTRPGSSARDAALRAAQAQGNLIRSQFPDMVEDGGEGLPNILKPRAASSPSNTTTGGRGAYAGQRFSLQNLPAMRRKMGVSSDGEVKRRVEQGGGVFY